MCCNFLSIRYDVATTPQEDNDGVVSELVIHDAQMADSGTFVCHASNQHGQLTSDFHLAVQGMLIFCLI